MTISSISPRLRRRIVALALIAAGLAVILIFAGTAIRRGASEPSVRGLITNVQQFDIGHASTITLRANDGRVLQFQVQPSVDMTPGHMREHMTYGQPVTIFYRQNGSVLQAVRLVD
jgi:hypothetical protein